ncbi:hypothetical protein RhiJN_17002 [Ceratobasidium sp. AG-Ba]|nr:hypothetical protein RhiJN_17002 [Ceratobasidium sp. AG-Ba]
MTLSALSQDGPLLPPSGTQGGIVVVANDFGQSILAAIRDVKDCVTHVGEQVAQLDDRVTLLGDRVTLLEDRVTLLEDRLGGVEQCVADLKICHGKSEKTLEGLCGKMDLFAKQMECHGAKLNRTDDSIKDILNYFKEANQRFKEANNRHDNLCDNALNTALRLKSLDDSLDQIATRLDTIVGATDTGFKTTLEKINDSDERVYREYDTLSSIKSQLIDMFAIVSRLINDTVTGEAEIICPIPLPNGQPMPVTGFPRTIQELANLSELRKFGSMYGVEGPAEMLLYNLAVHLGVRFLVEEIEAQLANA